MHVVQVLVMDDRLDEQGRDILPVEPRVNPDLGGFMVIRPQANTSLASPVALLAPAYRQARHCGKILTTDQFTEEPQIVSLFLPKRFAHPRHSVILNV